MSFVVWRGNQETNKLQTDGSDDAPEKRKIAKKLKVSNRYSI